MDYSQLSNLPEVVRVTSGGTQECTRYAAQATSSLLPVEKLDAVNTSLAVLKLIPCFPTLARSFIPIELHI
jgi:hypothetical protein